jgi:chemotaxis protein CheD
MGKPSFGSNAELAMIEDGSPQNIFLQPGEIYLSDKPALVSTLLGSCVAVTMFSPRKRMGAICHGLLPSCKGKKPCECEQFCQEGMRYVDCSIRRMIEWLHQNGVNKEEMVVKVFGGSEMIGSGTNTSKESVGKQNIKTAFNVIENEMLTITALDVGGTRGRKIIFSTTTGVVLLKLLKKTDLETHG